jgi:Domain of unknown function (DUF4190)
MNGEYLPPPPPGSGHLPPGVSPGAPQFSNPGAASQGMAITSLVLGILSLVCFGCVAGIPAIILGHIAYSRARKLPFQCGGSGMAIAGFVMGYVSLLVTMVILPAMLLPALAKAKERAQSINCVNNMKQVGLAFRMWALDHNELYPFNVSTNQGGTLELCAPGSDGFDANAVLHFQVMANLLNTPKLLVCPSDASKQPASSFANLESANVSYLVRSGTNISVVFPSEILARCPVHGHTLLCDGSVQAGKRR